MVVQARARHEERAARVQPLEVERAHRAARRPEQRHEPARTQAVEALVERARAHAVVDHVDAAPAGDALDLVGEVAGAISMTSLRARRPSGMYRPLRSARCSRIAPDSNTGIGPSGSSWSTIAGIRLFGLIARNSGWNWSPLPILTGTVRYASPHSSSMMAIFQPLGVGQ